jgi:thiol-disulfide isomerase/thioredoxin
MKKILNNLYIILLLLLLFITTISAQTIKGNFNLLKNTSIRLEGFNGLKSYPISETKIDNEGNFTLKYSADDYGVGYLMASDNKPLYLILSGENIEVTGEALSYVETVKITKGQENKWFEQYAKEHPKREQALSAWIYLEKMYSTDMLFKVQKKPIEAIEIEKKRIKSEDTNFIEQLPEKSYVKWFLPTRKLVSSVSVVAQYRTDEIPVTIAAFRDLDYTDKRLYKSGLFKDAIESHFWLLENSGRSLDSVFIEMQLSIDAMIIGLVKDEQKLNEVADYLFDLLERHSLFKASEYLALKVLNEVSCTINSDLAKQLETYRAMKKGNIAPEIVFPKSTLNPSNAISYTKLSDIKSKYTLVVFGASWCPKCTNEIPEVAKNYTNWKKNGLEVVFVSLDEKEKDFINFASSFPFISLCDYQKWNSPIAQNYYVFGTPTMYLLDDSRKIILRPNSVKQMEAWVDWYLVQGNPLPKN